MWFIIVFDEFFELCGLLLMVGLSVGIVMVFDVGYDLSELMSNVDFVMYCLKVWGWGSYILFIFDMVELYKCKFYLVNGIE